MRKDEINTLIKKLSIINGEKLQGVLRAGSMAMFQFGAYIEKDSHKYSKGKIISTEKHFVPKLQLHIDCCFRLSCGNEIIFAKGDIFLPRTITEKNPDFDWDNFDWDIKGNNKFDEIVNYYFSKEPLDFIVRSTEVSKFGDLKIIFENDFILEVFADVSGSEECWRFFEVGSEKHVVVSSQGLENDACEDS